MHKGCPTDLTGAQWAILEPLLRTYWTGRPRIHDLRVIVNSILYVLRSGCTWRMLPNDLPSWTSVFGWVEREFGWTVEIATGAADAVGFTPQHRRWAAERSFAERQIETTEGRIWAATSRILPEDSPKHQLYSCGLPDQ